MRKRCRCKDRKKQEAAEEEEEEEGELEKAERERGKRRKGREEEREEGEGRADKNTEDGTQQKQFELRHCGCSAVSWGRVRGRRRERAGGAESQPCYTGRCSGASCCCCKSVLRVAKRRGKYLQSGNRKTWPGPNLDASCASCWARQFLAATPAGFLPLYNTHTHRQRHSHIHTDPHTHTATHSCKNIIFINASSSAAGCVCLSVSESSSLSLPLPLSPPPSARVCLSVCTVHCRLPGWKCVLYLSNKRNAHTAKYRQILLQLSPFLPHTHSLSHSLSLCFANAFFIISCDATDAAGSGNRACNWTDIEWNLRRLRLATPREGCTQWERETARDGGRGEGAA